MNVSAASGARMMMWAGMLFDDGPQSPVRLVGLVQVVNDAGKLLYSGQVPIAGYGAMLPWLNIKVPGAKPGDKLRIRVTWKPGNGLQDTVIGETNLEIR